MTGPTLGGILLEYFNYPICVNTMALMALTMVFDLFLKNRNNPLANILSIFLHFSGYNLRHLFRSNR